jgi:hypothetical protein
VPANTADRFESSAKTLTKNADGFHGFLESLERFVRNHQRGVHDSTFIAGVVDVDRGCRDPSSSPAHRTRRRVYCSVRSTSLRRGLGSVQKTNPSSKEELDHNTLLDHRPSYHDVLQAAFRPVVDQTALFDHEPESDEQALLAEADELVREGVWATVNEDGTFACPYSSHRPSDWEDADGRIVCGICHPRPSGCWQRRIEPTP